MGHAALQPAAVPADAVQMQTWLFLPYLALMLCLVRSLLVAAKVVAPQCRRCGLQQERRELGERICTCG